MYCMYSRCQTLFWALKIISEQNSKLDWSAWNLCVSNTLKYTYSSKLSVVLYVYKMKYYPAIKDNVIKNKVKKITAVGSHFMKNA